MRLGRPGVTVLEFALNAAALWLLCTLWGWSALSWVEQPWRDRLFPAVPAFGAAFGCALLYGTGLVVGASSGAWISVVVSVALLGVAAWRGRAPWRVGRSGWSGLALGMLAAAPGVLVASWPSLVAGTSRIVYAATNLDSIYYAGEDAWFSEHSLLEQPVVGANPGEGSAVPIEMPAQTARELPLRIGQVLLTAASQSLTGQDQMTGFMPSLAVWIAVGGGAWLVALRLCGADRWSAAAGSLLISSLLLTTRSAFDQHADSLLGMSLVGLAAATYLGALRTMPRWPAAVMMAGLVGIYTEYLTFIGLPLAVATLLPLRDWRRRLARGLQVVLIAVLVSLPLCWWAVRAVVYMLSGSHGGDSFFSPFLDPDPWLSVRRGLGVTGVYETEAPGAWWVLIALGLVVAVCAALALGPYRSAVALVLLLAGAQVAMATLGERGYLQDRVVTLAGPLVAAIAVLGLAHGLRRLRRARPRWAGAALAVAMAWVVGASVANLATGLRSSDDAPDPAFLPTDNYSRLAGWVAEHGGEDGEQVTVAVSDLISQSWVQYALRDHRDVAYLSVQPSYAAPERYWGGELDRRVLVGPGVPWDAADAAVAEEVGRFRLLDTSSAGLAIAAPATMTSWAVHVPRDGHPTALDGGEITLLHHGTRAVHLTLASVSGVAETGAVVVDGRSRPVVVGPEPTAVRLRLPAGAGAVSVALQMDPSTDGQPSAGWRLMGIEAIERGE
jgi:hypothetical protein